MKISSRRALARSASALAVFAGAAVAIAQPRVPLEYHYSFYKEPIPMILDTSSVAIFDSALAQGNIHERQGNMADLAEKLEPLGLPAVNFHAHGKPGWNVGPIAITARSADDRQTETEALVKSIADSGAVEFVSPVFQDQYGPRFVTQEIFIGFDESLTHAQADEIFARLNVGEIVARNWENQPNVYLVRSSSRSGFDVLRQANEIAQHEAVRFAEPNAIFTVKTMLTPNDPLYPSMWHLRQNNDIDIDADEAWDITTGVSTIKVAVLDTGTQSLHPDLNGIPGFDATATSAQGEPVTSCDNHGTQVAGCIAAKINNGLNAVGVAPNTRVAGVKTLTIPAATICGNSGSGGDFVSGLNWAASNGFRVTNASLGFGASVVIENAYVNTRNQGLIHFAATGNESSGTIGFPSSSAGVNAVGSITTSGARSSFSNFGTGIDFSAPGSGIITLDRTGGDGDSNGDTITQSGTSFASPIAAGVAALVLSRNPFLSPAQVETIMQNSAVNLGAAGYDTTFGWGLVNARAALQATTDPTPPGAFTLIAPASGATQQIRLPSFSWNPSNFATTYQLRVDNNADFSSPEVSIDTPLTSITLTGTPLNAATTYFWRVTAVNTLGTAVSTPGSSSFTTYTTAPASFDLTSPANGVTGQPLLVSFSWQSTPLAESYTITIDDNADFSSPFESATVVTTNYSNVTPFSSLNTYHWRVVANNVIGSTASNPASRSFTVQGAVPGAFNLLSPADGPNINTATPTLDWSDSGGAATYTVQVDDLQDFSSPEINQTGVVASQFPVPAGVLQNQTRYYWRVFAVNAFGTTQAAPSNRSFGVVVANCQGDANRDGDVNFADITAVLARFGATGGGQGDANFDNAINFADITAVLSTFGADCP